MEYTIPIEDKQDLHNLTELLKAEEIPKWKILIMIGYARGRADEIKLQPTGA